MSMNKNDEANLPAPAPMPSRATYGFASYLMSFVAFGAYLVWTFFPESALENLGFTMFYPQKYWSLAIPIHLCVTLLAIGLIFYPAINLTLVPTATDISLITDEFANYEEYEYDAEAIPPMTDIPVSKICEMLFLKE